MADLAVAKKIDDLLNQVDYSHDYSYVPSPFALEFVTFIKLVNGGKGEENKTPVLHYRMLDTIAGGGSRIANMVHRGAAKTSIFAEYLILYLAVYGDLPGIGKVNLGIYVSDSIENGIKNLRKNLEHRWENSEFLRKYVPETRFTDVRWEFTNADGKVLIFKGYGAKALSLDSVLYTATGTTTIGACQVGDRIYGPDGKLTTIVKKSEIFNKPMYRITLKDRRSIKVSEDHINSVVVNTNPNNTVRWEKKDLTTKELLEQPLLHTKIGNKRHKGTSSKYLVFVENTQPLQYPEKDLPVDPYTLGVVLGDGRIQKPSGAVELTAHKEDMPNYRQHIPYEWGKGRYDARNPNTWTQSIRGLGPGLRKLGLVVHGSEKFIPEEYFTASIQQRYALLQGLMDTDGTISASGRTSFCSTSSKLLNDVIRLVRSLGGTANTSNKAHCCEIWLNQPLFRLERKLNRQRWDRKDDKVAIVSIERIADEPSQCIAVDNEDHQFLTDNYFRTHNTGVRGVKELGQRPTLALLDDLLSDEDSRSDTVIASIEDTVYKAVTYALHPTKNKIIWNGTPFNARDPLYKAIESGAWDANVYPVCEKFPCTKEEFKGSWEDRFTYEYVKTQYESAVKLGKVDTFMQELMLRIMSTEDRMIRDSDIGWYKIDSVIKQKGKFNFYITTDFAVAAKQKNDYSVISVWAYNCNGDWFWVDGVCKRQLMDKNIDELFRLAQQYKPQQVGIEVSGQQAGFIQWIQGEMMSRNIYFPLASENNDNNPGIRPNTNKLMRFNVVVPWFKARKIYFPLEKKHEPELIEGMEELQLVSVGGFKSKHDDFIDTISMLASLNPWKPSQDIVLKRSDDSGIWEIEPDEEPDDRLISYIV